MPLIRNIEDPKFVKQLDMLDHRNQFVHELAIAILPGNRGFERVWSIANRVYDGHCPALRKCRSDRQERTALTA